MKIEKLVRLLFITFFLLLSESSYSAIAYEQKLTFGKVVIIDNDSVYQMIIQPDGQISSDSQIAIITPGKAGRYLLYDLPANTPLNLEISSTPVASGFNNGVYDALFSFVLFLKQSNISTNSLGEANVEVGGVLKTSGDGKTYFDGEYYQVNQLIINY